jgi:flavin reductase (DIM6/NTAB) family NADH-FMN oxidoreductase RutF
MQSRLTCDADQLRRLMRLWTSGVTIVTAQAGAEQHGMTVSSFTSVSLTPPLVLISLASSTRTAELVRRGGHFGVTFLAEGQQSIADRFAGRGPDDADRFRGLPLFTLASGVPFIQGGLAFLDCRLSGTHPAGTSTLFIGEVIAARQVKSGKPLVYFDRDYQDLCS